MPSPSMNSDCRSVTFSGGLGGCHSGSGVCEGSLSMWIPLKSMPPVDGTVGPGGGLAASVPGSGSLSTLTESSRTMFLLSVTEGLTGASAPPPGSARACRPGRCTLRAREALSTAPAPRVDCHRPRDGLGALEHSGLHREVRRLVDEAESVGAAGELPLDQEHLGAGGVVHYGRGQDVPPARVQRVGKCAQRSAFPGSVTCLSPTRKVY